MAHKPTEQQQIAIDSKSALIVSAAAGSGKTATLTDRVLRLVTDKTNPIDINRLLIVTFTNSAAAEMRERIAAKFSERYAAEPQNKRLLNQMLLLPQAPILTIDSFCKKIVTENYAFLGLSPEIQYLNTAETVKLFEDALNELFDTYLRDNYDNFITLARALNPTGSTSRLKEAVEEIYSSMRAFPFPELYMETVQNMYNSYTNVCESIWGKEILDNLTEKCTLARDSINSVLADFNSDPEVVSTSQKRIDMLQSWSDALTEVLGLANAKDWDGIRNFTWAVSDFKLSQTKNEHAKKRSTDVRNKYTDVIDFVTSAFIDSAANCDLINSRLKTTVAILFDMVKKYMQIVRRRMDECGKYDFAEVELLALSLLYRVRNGKIEKTEICDSIAAAYDEVLVDEYQDVNDLQNQIFRGLSRDESKLFVVGDVKQCIYRFREANPENFLRLLKERPKYVPETPIPSSVVLSGNFRSREGICGATNFIFSRLFSTDFGGINYADGHSLEKMGTFPERDEHDARFIFIDSTESELSDAQLEAIKIADIIEDMMSRDCISEKDRLRPAEYKDFTVLLRASTNADEMIDVLKGRGIPCRKEAQAELFASQEIMQLLSLLRVINNPTDDVSLLSSMTSPMFGFSNEKLSDIRLKKRFGPIYNAIVSYAENGDEQCANYLEFIRKMRRFAVTAPVDTLITKIYDTTGILSACVAMPDGTQKKANLKHLITLASDCRANGCERLDSFLRYVDRLIESEKNPSPQVEGENSVTFSTIHKSKGLQYPVCFVANCAHTYSSEDIKKSVLLDSRYGVTMKLVIPDTNIIKSNFVYETLKGNIKKNARAEELRMYYVAMTRAKDNLFVLSTYNTLSEKLNECRESVFQTSNNFPPLPVHLVKNSSNFGKLLMYCLMTRSDVSSFASLDDIRYGIFSPNDKTDFELEFVNGENFELCDNGDQSDTTTVTQRANGDHLLDEIERRLEFVSPYLALRGEAKKRTASKITENTLCTDSVFELVPSFVQNEKLNAAEKGTALHRFMQYADFTHAANNLEREIELLHSQGFLTDLQTECIDKQKLAEFFKSALYHRIEKSQKVMREQRFLTALPARDIDPYLPEIFEDEKFLIQGSADCVFVEDGELIIVDYKTDRVTSFEQLIERYSPQLDVYAKAFETNMGIKVREKIIYSFALSREISL